MGGRPGPRRRLPARHFRRPASWYQRSSVAGVTRNARRYSRGSPLRAAPRTPSTRQLRWPAVLSQTRPPRNVGARALKIPSRLKAANPATPAAKNSCLPDAGKPKPAKRMESLSRRGTVSGTQATMRAALGGFSASNPLASPASRVARVVSEVGSRPERLTASPCLCRADPTARDAGSAGPAYRPKTMFVGCTWGPELRVGHKVRTHVDRSLPLRRAHVPSGTGMSNVFNSAQTNW